MTASTDFIDAIKTNYYPEDADGRRAYAFAFGWIWGKLTEEDQAKVLADVIESATNKENN